LFHLVTKTHTQKNSNI